jgi:hypothetical protein
MRYSELAGRVEINDRYRQPRTGDDKDIGRPKPITWPFVVAKTTHHPQARS